MSYVARAYRDAADHAAIVRLVQDVYAATGPHVPFTIGDLGYWLAQESADEPLHSSRLWFANDALVGFVWPEPEFLDLIVHPAHAAATTELLDWGEDWQRTNGHTEVGVRALDSDTAYAELLRERGYAPGDEAFSWYGVRELTSAPAAPTLPPGYAIRDSVDPDVLEELHRVAGAGRPVRAYRVVQAAAAYRADLDLVAVAADGTPVAFALTWFDEANAFGVFEPVGCSPDHRRRGLASALMTEGLRRLHALGATHALVANLESSVAADRAYRRLGFVTQDRSVTWSRSLS